MEPSPCFRTEDVNLDPRFNYMVADHASSRQFLLPKISFVTGHGKREPITHSLFLQNGILPLLVILIRGGDGVSDYAKRSHDSGEINGGNLVIEIFFI